MATWCMRARSSSAPSWSARSPRTRRRGSRSAPCWSWHAPTLPLADPAGARNVISEAEAIVRRRPALGTLIASLEDMRERLRDASTALAGPSALSTAELRLLPILSTPLTFKEIGERMFLSRHTVKTQAISIYGKLGASSRSEAVQRAIELGLLDPFPGLAPGRRPSAG